MRISQKLDYACRALVHLARHHSDGKVTRAEVIAEKEKIPLNFLAQILNELKRSHFVISKRGKTGGWILAKPPADLSLLDIVKTLEPDSLIDSPNLSGDSAPAINSIWLKIREQTSHTLSAATLEKVATSDEAPMYFI